MGHEDHFRKLERMYLGAPCNRYYAPSIAIAEGKAEIGIVVRDEFFHAAGAVHGSVYFKALDDAAFFAANSLVGDVFVLTASFELRLLKPVSSGVLKAVGSVTRSSSQLILAEASLLSSDGTELARGSGKFLKSSIPLTEKLGYH